MKSQAVDVNKKWKKEKKKKKGIEDATDTNNTTKVEVVNSIDITDIVDECFKEEREEEIKIIQTSVLDNGVCIINSNESCEDNNQIQNVLDEQKHSALCFTIEEEFQIHDLIAKREFMNDIFAQIKNNALSACDKDSMVTKTKDGKWLYGKNLMHASQNLGQHIGKVQIHKNHFKKGNCASPSLFNTFAGSVRFQDVFDEFRNVKRNIAYE